MQLWQWLCSVRCWRWRADSLAVSDITGGDKQRNGRKSLGRNEGYVYASVIMRTRWATHKNTYGILGPRGVVLELTGPQWVSLKAPRAG